MVDAVVLLNTEFESPREQVFENLKEIDGVDKAFITDYGVYDVVAKVKTKTITELKNNVLESIRKIDAVASIMALVVAE